MPISSTKFNTEDLSLASSVTSNDFIEIRKYDSLNDSYESQKVSAASVGKTYHEGHGIEIDSNNNINATTVGNSTYSTSPIKTGGLWIDNNDIFKKVINCGTLPNTDTATIAHNINGLDRVVKWETIATNSTLYIDFNNLVESIDATNITITTTSDMSGYTGYVTIYYTLKKQFHKLSSADSYFYATNGNNTNLTDPTNSSDVYVGLYSRFGDYRFCIAIMSKTGACKTAHYAHNRTGSGNITLTEHNGNYYNTIEDPGNLNPYESNGVGIQVVFANLTECLNAFYS